MYKLQLYPGIGLALAARCFTNFRVRVLQILVQFAFYKFESSPRFTNLSPVRVLEIWVQSAFYKFESSPRLANLSPVRVLQIWVQSAFYKFESSPRFTSPVQSAFYNMPF